MSDDVEPLCRCQLPTATEVIGDADGQIPVLNSLDRQGLGIHGLDVKGVPVGMHTIQVLTVLHDVEFAIRFYDAKYALAAVLWVLRIVINAGYGTVVEYTVANLLHATTDAYLCQSLAV